VLKLSKEILPEIAFHFGESLKVNPNYSSAVKQKIPSLKMLGREKDKQIAFTTKQPLGSR
jgi:hypothetical protein